MGGDGDPPVPSPEPSTAKVLVDSGDPERRRLLDPTAPEPCGLPFPEDARPACLRVVGARGQVIHERAGELVAGPGPDRLGTGSELVGTGRSRRPTRREFRGPSTASTGRLGSKMARLIPS